MDFKWHSEKKDDEQEQEKAGDIKWWTKIVQVAGEAPKRLILMAVCGILILFLSLPEIWKGWNREESKENKKEIVKEEKSQDETSLYVEQMEERLETMLGKIEGAGRVSVMITVKSTGEEVTEKDKPSTQENSHSTDGSRSESSSRLEIGEETVFTQTEEGKSVPFVVKQFLPEVEGVLVIMEGADNSSLKTDIIEGIQVLFNLPVHKIKVIRMKTAD